MSCLKFLFSFNKTKEKNIYLKEMNILEDFIYPVIRPGCLNPFIRVFYIFVFLLISIGQCYFIEKDQHLSTNLTTLMHSLPQVAPHLFS